jgi:HTH-type transcriptional regulator, transcriptional repressor of NAD biosynthesis genes
MTNKLKIVATGPESCGKTTLIQALAKHFHEPFSIEYARIYFQDKVYEYDLSDIQNIAIQQRKINDANFQKCNKISFSDTDESVLMIWASYVFNQTILSIEKKFDQNIPDLYLLMSPDIPWKNDPLRSNKNERYELFELYEQLLITKKRPYIIVSGDHESRLKKAIEEINILIKR